MALILLFFLIFLARYFPIWWYRMRAREPFDVEGTENECKAWIESKGYHLGNIMNAARLALVGEGKGPGIFDITEALGKEESIRRIQRAIEILK